MTCNFVAHSLHSGSHTRPCRFLPADGKYRHRQLAGQTAFIVTHRLINGAIIVETCAQSQRRDIGLDELLYGAWINRTWEGRSEEHTSELQSLMRISYAVFCLKQKTMNKIQEQSLT